MLRVIVLVLLMLNMGYFAWNEGWLRVFGAEPTLQREPQRLARQIRPEAVALTGDKELANEVATPRVVTVSASAPAAPPATCLQSGVLTGVQVNVVRRALLASLPDDAWSLDSDVRPASWMVYMGKFANPADRDKKRAELASLQLPLGRITNADLIPGLSLGTYPSRQAANEALDVLVRKGVRSAKVVQEWPERPGYRLRLPAVTEAMQKPLEPIKAALNGVSLSSCPAPASIPASTPTSAPAAAP